MKVAFRADVSEQIGTGHFIRCLTLADALKEKGAEVIFVSRALPQHLQEQTNKQGHEFKILQNRSNRPDADGLSGADLVDITQESDAQETIKSLSDFWRDLLIVDHYAFDARWESALSKRAGKIMVIDDLANRGHSADVLLDPTYGETEARYRDLVPPGCNCLCGGSYALLRPQFRQQRQCLERRIPAVEQLTVHVFFGGSDTDNHTFRISRMLLRGLDSVRLCAAVGKGYTGMAELQQLESEFGSRFSWKAGVTDMAAHMAACDVALGAPGGATWERACIGLPAAYLAVSKNQIPIIERLQASGFCVYLGEVQSVDESAFVAGMRHFLSRATALQAMRTLGMKAVDGGGAQRVVEALEKLL